MIFQPKLSFADAFTDSALSAKVNGEHREKALEPWDAGDLAASEDLEPLENDVVSAAFGDQHEPLLRAVCVTRRGWGFHFLWWRNLVIWLCAELIPRNQKIKMGFYFICNC